MFNYSMNPQAIHEVLQDAFKLYRLTFLKVWILAFITAVESTLLTIVYPAIRITGERGANVVVPKFHFSGIGFLSYIIAMVISIFLITMIMQRIHTMAISRKMTIGDLIKVSKSRFLNVFIASVLATIFIVLATCVFIIPGLFLSVLLILYLPLIVINEEKAWDGIKKSAKLVWGHWWFTFVLFLVPGIIVTVISTIVLLFFNAQNMVAQLVVNIIVSSIFLPFFVALLLVQCNNLALRMGKPLDTNQYQQKEVS